MDITKQYQEQQEAKQSAEQDILFHWRLSDRYSAEQMRNKKIERSIATGTVLCDFPIALRRQQFFQRDCQKYILAFQEKCCV